MTGAFTAGVTVAQAGGSWAVLIRGTGVHLHQSEAAAREHAAAIALAAHTHTFCAFCLRDRVAGGG